MAEGGRRRIAGDSNLHPEEVAMEMFNKLKTFFGDIKAKLTGEDNISFEDAALILHNDLHYPKDKALTFVKRFDKDNDGRLSRAEFAQMKGRLEETMTQLVPKFKEYDVDGNGFITLDEAAQILQKPPFNFPNGKISWLLKSFDKDGNGKLDIEEFAGFYAEAKALKDDIANCFDKLDKDGNGVLTPDEVVSIIQDRLGFDQETAKYMVEMFDQNKDGSLDKSEFMMLWTSMFGE